MIVTVYATSWARNYFNTDDLSINNVRENKNLNGNENSRLHLASTSRPLHTVDVQNQNLPSTRSYILSDIIQSFRNKNWKLDDKNGFSDEKKSEKRGMYSANGGVSDEFSSRWQLPEKKLALKHKLYEELTTKSSESARKKAEPLQGSIIFDSHEDTVTASSSAIMTPDIDDNHNNDNLEVGFDSSNNHPQISVTDKPISGKKIEKLQGMINSDDSHRLKYEDNGAEIQKATSGLAGSTRPPILQISNSVTSKNLNGTKIPLSVENPKFNEKSANENTSLLQKVGPVLKKKELPKSEETISGLAGSSGTSISQIADPITGKVMETDKQTTSAKNKKTGDEPSPVKKDELSNENVTKPISPISIHSSTQLLNAEEDPKAVNLTAPVELENLVSNNKTQPLDPKSIKKFIPLIHEDNDKSMKKTKASIPEDKKLVNVTVSPNVSNRNVAVPKSLIGSSIEKKTSELSESSGPIILQISDPVFGKNKGISGSFKSGNVTKPNDSTAPIKQEKKNINKKVTLPVNHSELNESIPPVPGNIKVVTSKKISSVTQNKKPVIATALPSASTRDDVVLENHTDPSNEKKTSGLAGSSVPAISQISDPVSGTNKGIGGSSSNKQAIEPTNSTAPMKQDEKINSTTSAPVNHTGLNKKPSLVPSNKTPVASKTAVPVTQNKKPVNAAVLPSASSRDVVVLKNHADPRTEKKIGGFAGSSEPSVLHNSSPVSGENKGITGSSVSGKDIKPTNLTDPVQNNNKIHKNGSYPVNHTNSNPTTPMVPANPRAATPKRTGPVLPKNKPVNASFMPSASIRDVMVMKNFNDPSNEKKTSGFAGSSGPAILQISDPLSGKKKDKDGSSGSKKEMKPTNLTEPVKQDKKIADTVTVPMNNTKLNKPDPSGHGNQTTAMPKTVIPVLLNKKPVNASVLPSTSTRDIVALKNRTDPSNEKNTSGLAASSGPKIPQVSDHVSGKNKGIGGSSGSGKKIMPTNLTATVLHNNKIHKNGTYPVSQINSNKTLHLVPGNKTAPASKTVSPVIKNEKPVDATVMPSDSIRDVVVKNHTDPSNEKNISGLAASSGTKISQVSYPVSGKNKGIGGSSGSGKKIMPTNLTAPVQHNNKIHKNGTYPVSQINLNKTLHLVPGKKIAPAFKTVSPAIKNEKPINATVMPSASTRDVVVFKNRTDPDNEKNTSGLAASSRSTNLQISDPVSAKNKGISGSSSKEKVIKQNNVTVPIKPSMDKNKKNSEPLQEIPSLESAPLSVGNKTANIPKAMDSDVLNRLPINNTIRLNGSIVDVVGLRNHSAPNKDMKTKISDPVFGKNEGINALSGTGNHTNLNNTEPLGPGKKTSTTLKTVGSEKHNEKPVNLPSASMREVIVLNSSTVPSFEKKLSGSSGVSGPASTLSDLISGKNKSISGFPVTGINKKPVHLTNPYDISQLKPTRPTKIVNIKFNGPTVVNVVKSKDGSRPFVLVNVPYYLQYPRSLSSHSPPSTNQINSRSDELINTKVSRIINDSFQKQATRVFDSYNDKATASFDSIDYDLTGDSAVRIKENSGIPTYLSMNIPPLNSIKPSLNIISSTSCIREIGDVFLDNLTLIQLYASDRPQLDDNYPGYKITCIRCSSISNGLRKELGLTIVRSGNGCRYIFDRRELDLSNLLGYCQIFGRRRRWNDQAVLPC
ncbi:hypothetical protein TKK_0001473 [Trichogramma kaykai]